MANNLIVKDAKNISLSLPKGKTRTGFCEIWPTAKTALGLLRDMVKNPALKVVITTIIGVGDAVASRVCS